MAESLMIPGPMIVYYRIVAASPVSFTLLGRWDNDAPAEWHEEMIYRDVTTNTGGETPEESIVRGLRGRLNFVLDKWDTAQIKAMKKATNRSSQTAGWKYPLIGGLQVGTLATPLGGTFDLQFTPAITGRLRYTFYNLRMRPVDLSPFGNQPLNLGLSFELMRPSDADDDDAYIIEDTT